LNAAQQAVNEQMLRALEEDQYSAAGSIVDTESDEDDEYMYRGKPVRLDRSAIQQAIKKMAHLERMGAAASSSGVASGGGTSAANNTASSGDGDKELEDGGGIGRGGIKKKQQQKKKDDHSASGIAALMDDDVAMTGVSCKLADDFSDAEEDLDRDGGSIFGATTGSSNSTWVECDKCKKWRRLRGVVDEKKLPTKWYCSMNRNDPERARCSAPEEEYDTLQTPESAADSKARKHLRVWVRRLQCNEAYEARQPTLTRGKKRATASSSKDPYEWVRCCNPSCGKWRAVLRIMDAKSNVIDRTKDGEWYCVMNTWDEKTASCAAPQENLPAVGTFLAAHRPLDFRSNGP
jgi:CW-type Zinc Finger